MAAKVNKKALVIAVTLLLAVTIAAVALAMWMGNKEERAREFLAEARLLAVQERYDQAIIQYQNAIKNAPDAIEGHLELADIYMKRGDLQNAFSHCRIASQKNPRSVDALSRLASFYLLAGEWGELRHVAAQVVTLAPGGKREAEAHAHLAKTYYRDGEHEQAAASFARAVAIDGSDVESLLALALINAQFLNAPGDAERTLQVIIARASDESLGARERSLASAAAGGFYAVTGKNAEAEMFYKGSIRVQPDNPQSYIRLADFYRQRGDAPAMALAEEAYVEAARIDAASGLNLGLFYRETGRRDRAIQVFSSAIASVPAPILYQQLIECLIDDGELDGARARLGEMKDIRVGASTIDYLQGRIILAASKGRAPEMRRAEDLFARVAKQQPQFPQGHYYLGLCLSARGMLDAAAERFRRTLELAPTFTDAAAALAEAYMRSYQVERAVIQAQGVLARSPSDYHANLIMGRALFAQGNVAGAQRHLLQAQAARPGGIDAYLALAELAAAQRDYDSARAHLASAAENVADPFRARMMMALLEQQQGRAAEALAMAWQLASADPRNTAGASFYASLLWQQGRAQEAAEFLKARAGEHQSADYFVLAGDFQRTLGRSQEALDSYAAALQAAPGLAGAMAGTAGTLASLGRHEQAREHLKAMRQYDPGSPAADLIEARVLVAEGRRDAAATLLAATIRQNPANAEAYYRLGLIQQERGELTLAAENLKSALRYNPAYVAARLSLAQLYYQTRFYQDALREAQRISQAADVDTALLSRALAIATGSFVETGRMEDAITTWSQLPPEVQSTGDYMVRLGYLYLMSEDYDRAQEAFIRARSLLEEASPALEGLAQLYMSQRRYAEAAETIEGALSGRLPAASRVRLLQMSANIKLLAGDQEGVLAALSDLVTACGDDAALLVQAGDSFFALGRVEDAVGAYRNAVRAVPNHVEARRRLVSALAHKGELAEARSIVDAMLAAAPADFDNRVLKAQLLLAEDKTEDALAMLSGALASAPAQGKGAAMANYLMGSASYRQRNVTVAETHLRRALSLDPGIVQARLLLAKVFLLKRAHEGAAVEARHIIRENPASAEAYGILGDVASLAGDRTAAVENYRKSLSLQKSSAVAVALANTLMAAGRGDEAVGEMAAYMQAVPGDVDTANVLARMYHARKDYAAAEASLRGALSAAPGDVRTVRALAQVYRDAGRTDDATALIEPWLARQEFRDAYVVLAGVHAAAQRFGDGERVLGEAVRRDSGYLPNYEALAGLLAGQNRGAEAVEILKRGVSANPSSESFHLSLARLYRRLGMGGENEAFLTDVAGKNPRFAEVACDLGEIHLARGDNASARAVYERAWRFAPEHPRVANALAYILAEEGVELARAVQLATLARDRNPGDPNTHDTLGWAYYKDRQYDKAVVSLTEADRLARSASPVVLHHLALAFDKRGARDRARETAGRLVALDPSYAQRNDIADILR